MALGKNVVYTLATQIPLQLVGITSGIFLNRMLTPTGKGIWALLQTNVEIFAMVAVMGLPTAMLYFVSGNRMPLSKLMGVAVMAVGSITILLASILLFSQGTPLYGFVMPDGPDQPVYLLYLLVFFLSACTQSVIDPLLIARNKIRRNNQLAIFTSAFTLITAILLFFVFRDENFHTNLVHFLVIQTVMFGCLAAYRITLYARLGGQWPSFRLSWHEHWRPILMFSAITYLSQVMNVLNYRLVMWVLEDQRGTTDVGLYIVAVNLAQLLWLFATPVQPLMTSFLAKPEHTEEEKIARFSFFMRLVMTLSLVGGIIGFMVAPLGINLLYSEAYQASVLPFRILLPGIILMGFTKVFAAWFIANKKLYNLMMGTGIGLVCTLVLNSVLIPRYGLTGAALSSTCTYGSMMLFHYLSFRFYYRQPFSNLFLLSPKEFKSLLRGKLPV